MACPNSFEDEPFCFDEEHLAESNDNESAQPSISTNVNVSNKTHEKFANANRIRLNNCFKCVQWSENPQMPKWSVNLLLHSESPQDLSNRIGFIVLSSDAEIFGKRQDGNDIPSATYKLHSDHSIMDNSIFQQLLIKGAFFTKIELSGNIFNNAELWPHPLTSNVDPELINLPSVKTLIIKAHMGVALKGADFHSQAVYYENHSEHLANIKSRAARNLWFVISTLNCPELEFFEFQDFVDWDENKEELKQGEFQYYKGRLIKFIQRHANSLKTLKMLPLTIMQINGKAPESDDTELFPVLEDLLFKTKFQMESVRTTSEQLRKLLFYQTLDTTLDPWRQFLKGQNALKSLAWITDANGPWPYTNKEFVRLVQNNLGLQTLMITLHGEEVFEEQVGLHGPNSGKGSSGSPYSASGSNSSNRKNRAPLNKKPSVIREQPPSDNISAKDFQIDTAVIHGLQALKILSIGCYSTDPQLKYFSIYNLQLLPGTLQHLQILGIRVMGEELEQMGHYLKRLKSLTIIQSAEIVYTDHDEENTNIEGVTAGALKAFSNIRTLEYLLIIGFPMKMKIPDQECDEEEDKDNADLEISKRPSVGWFGSMCGAMCFPGERDPSPSSSSKTDIKNDKKIKSADLSRYSGELRQMLMLLENAAEIQDIQRENDGGFSTLLRIGDMQEANVPFAA